MEVSRAHPEGYDLIPEVVALSKKQTKASGVSFKTLRGSYCMRADTLTMAFVVC